MTLIACVVLTLAIGVYVFFPARKVTAQTEKSRAEYLEERKAVLYDNLRDLSFEHRAGKYRDDEYATERVALETEAAVVVEELAQLDGKAHPSPGAQPGFPRAQR